MMHTNFLTRFWVCSALTIPVLLLANPIVLFLLSSIIFFYGGWPFLRGAVHELHTRTPGMMVLIAVAITVAYGYSTLVAFGVPGTMFYWELATLIDIMLLGHYIEMRSVMGASKALHELAKLMPPAAHVLQTDGSTQDVSLENLKLNDRVLVRPGEKIPADGVVSQGSSYVNVSALTGESKPVSKKVDDTVIGGSINGSGALTITVQKTGSDSYLAQVMALVEQAQKSKSRVQALADKAALVLTIVALGAGTITLFTWLGLGSTFNYALERMVSVMVITCPHALGLAIPLVIAMVAGIAARRGLLIRNKAAFEQAANLDVIVFDKTGTLTKGEFGVSDVVPLGDEENVLTLAASLEQHSEHSIARSIVAHAKEPLLPVQDVQAIAGVGVKGVVNGKEVRVGNVKILDQAPDVPKAKDLEAQGKTVVYVCSETQVLGLIALADVVRPESKEACTRLLEGGYQLAMITGDNEQVAAAVATQLGIKTVFARVMPDQKAQKIIELQKQGKKVAMVGDGINDAPALVQADVGIAIGAGTEVAIESADVILTKSDPRQVADTIELSRITKRKMVQNLVWATGYNVFAIPLAAGVLAPWGIVLPPAVGAIIMSISTVIVAINARLIRY